MVVDALTDVGDELDDPEDDEPGAVVVDAPKPTAAPACCTSVRASLIACWYPDRSPAFSAASASLNLASACESRLVTDWSEFGGVCPPADPWFGGGFWTGGA